MLPIAPEGRVFVTLAALILAVSHILLSPALAWPSWVLMAAVLFIFREPRRSESQRPLQGVLSPVDGVVQEITEHEDPYLQRPSLRIIIRQARLGPFNLRYPVEGKVKARWIKGSQHKDRPTPADRFALWLHTDEQEDIVCALDTAGFHLLRSSVQTGERVGQGRRCGFLGLGGRQVELYLPPDCRSEVRPGRAVKAGLDLIATRIARPHD
ncbi:phosphatidylserine decarboxylase [Thiorhodospira sibirica]|uniref:phosphatidylserine decarboxylase n=1 Tax=Thiorhodospira sibirica TaxID=154347 RepID=UPI00022C5867|nr:phosphatidylserine decarboxylase [Thiorhodospira sibirica]